MVTFRQDVAPEVQAMGKSFGIFIEEVGRGVAQTQKRLDMNSAEITKELADTVIEVPAVIEQVLDDKGAPQTGGNAVNVSRQQMSLIQYIVPTFYQWRHVQLNLSFDVEELGTIDDFKIKTRKKTDRFLGMAFGGSESRTTSGVMEAKESERADGSVDARLEPRPDITPPTPFLFRTGPSIHFVPGADIKDQADNVVGANLTVKVLKADGTPNDGQTIKVNVMQGRYTLPQNGTLTTNADGEVTLEIRKVDPAATEPVKMTVTVMLGIVSGRMDVTI